MEVCPRQEGTVTVLALRGELDALWSETARRAIEAEVERGHRRLVLDLSAVEYMSSAGLRVLLQLQRSAAAQGFRMCLAEPQALVKEVLAFSGFDQLLSVYDTVAAGVYSLAPEPGAELPAGTGSVDHVTGIGTFRFQATGAPLGSLRVTGCADDLLYSQAQGDRLTPVPLAGERYSFGVGALAPTAAAALERLGELLVLPGAALWLPGDGRTVPDYLLASTQAQGEVTLQVLHALHLEGKAPFQGEFSAADSSQGTTLKDLARELLDWAEGQSGYHGTVGFAMLAEVVEWSAVSLKRSPRAENAPPNGEQISQREHIKQWFHSPRELSGGPHPVVAVGVAHSRSSLTADAVAAEGARTLHVHGGLYRPLSVWDERPWQDRLQYLLEQGELLQVAHLLPATRLRRASLLVWLPTNPMAQ